MNKKRHGTFFVLERELFWLKKFKKKSIFFSKKITAHHSTCRGTCRCAVNLRHDGTCRTASLLLFNRPMFQGRPQRRDDSEAGEFSF
jgi:hypothetical protein